MLMNRFAEYWNDGNTHNVAYKLFEQYYENLIGGGAFDGVELDIAVIVDNDYINYTAIVTEDEFEQYGFTHEEAEDDGRILAEYQGNYPINVT